MATQDDFTYHLIWSQAADEAFRELWRQAREDGREKELLRIFNAINDLLRTTPLGLGTLYRSKGSVEEHKFGKGILAIEFAVDLQRQFVLVRDCWLSSAKDPGG